MSDTPQSDDVINEEVNAVETINDSALESDTSNQVQDESNEQVEQVDEVEAAKQKANLAFNKQYGEKKQLERDLAAQREVNAKFEQAERERQAAQVGNIPAMPDAFDDDYEQKVKRRDEAIIANANYQASNNAYIQQQEFTQQQAAQAKRDEVAKLANDFTVNAKKIGASDGELSSVVTALNNAGMTADLGQAIMSDPDGYLIAKHLAANPIEANEIITANPYIVGAKFAEIKAKASALKPKTSSTPKPADNLQGNGAAPGDGYKNISGAKFE